MTEKRFVHYEHKGADYILENPNTNLDFIEMLGDCLDEKETVNRLNELYEENEHLKRELQIFRDGLRAEIRETKEIFEDYSECVDETLKLKEENKQLRKIGVMYQGKNPCETCTYSLENKVCCAEPIPISCDDAKKNFIQGLCKKHKQFPKSIRRYDDE